MTPFQIPDAFLHKLYELTGSANKNKGFFLFVVDDEGEPRPLISQMDSVTRMALRKCAEIYLRELDDHDGIGSLSDFEDESE